MRGMQGFTLLETMFAVAIFTIVTGALFTMSLAFADSADVQNIRANSNDAARRMYLEMVPELRQAARTSINFNALPGNTIRFRTPADLDGNGTAVNSAGRIELAPEVTIGPDSEDANNDGIRDSQLVRRSGDTVTVLSTGLADSAVITNTDGSTSTVDGIWFRPRGNAIEVILVLTGTDRRGREYQSTFRQIVTPRN